MLKLRRCYLTLMEMLIVLAILALMTGVVGINVRRALQHQRFRTEVDLVVDTLRLAQDLMLIVGADVTFSLYKSEKEWGIEYKLDVDGQIPKKWQPVIARSHRQLRETHYAQFKGAEEGPVEIRFFSGGASMSRGVLRLSTHQDDRAPGALTRAVVLPGYPHPIVSIPEGETSVKLEEEQDDEFSNRLTTYTIQEILEDVPPKEASEPEEQNRPEETKREKGP